MSGIKPYIGVAIEATEPPKRVKKKEQIKRLESKLEAQYALVKFACEQLQLSRDESSENARLKAELQAIQEALLPHAERRNGVVDWVSCAKSAHDAISELEKSRYKSLITGLLGTPDEIALGDLLETSEQEVMRLRSENLSLLSQVISLDRGSKQLQVELSASEERAALLEEELDLIDDDGDPDPLDPDPHGSIDLQHQEELEKAQSKIQGYEIGIKMLEDRIGAIKRVANVASEYILHCQRGSIPEIVAALRDLSSAVAEYKLISVA